MPLLNRRTHSFVFSLFLSLSSLFHSLSHSLSPSFSISLSLPFTISLYYIPSLAFFPYTLPSSSLSLSHTHTLTHSFAACSAVALANHSNIGSQSHCLNSAAQRSSPHRSLHLSLSSHT